MTPRQAWSWFRAKLADDVTQAWKWLQVQLVAVLAIAPQIYDNAEVLQQMFSPKTFHAVMSVVGALTIINALRKKKAA